jgi:hypothetical protein
MTAAAAFWIDRQAASSAAWSRQDHPEIFSDNPSRWETASQLARLRADARGRALERSSGPYDRQVRCRERFQALIVFRCLGPVFIGHSLVKNTVACQHQIIAKLAERKMLTCFTFPPTVSFFGQPSGLAGGIFMAEYRAYLVDRDDHFFDTVHLTCADDAEAIEQALALAMGHGVELWQLDRKVALFPDQNKTP